MCKAHKQLSEHYTTIIGELIRYCDEIEYNGFHNEICSMEKEEREKLELGITRLWTYGAGYADGVGLVRQKMKELMGLK
jgi:hypothetical protein